MKIYFVRHGEPNPENGLLTELGHKQAQAAALLLKDSNIEHIFASTLSRAYQTAEYTAKILGLDITPCDFIREISWRSLDSKPIPENGHPWCLSARRASEGKSIFMNDWQNHYPYCNSEIVKCYNSVLEGIDGWLEEFGYKREGDYYRVIGNDTEKTVAIFSHAGSSSVALSHILNIPFPQFCGAFCPSHASITVIDFPNKAGELVYPAVLVFNDAKHIEGITASTTFLEN